MDVSYMKIEWLWNFASMTSKVEFLFANRITGTPSI